MNKLFHILSVITLLISFVSCGNKKESSENYQQALSYYEKGINKIKTDNEVIHNDSLIDAFSKFIESLRLLEKLPEDMNKEEISLASKAYYQLSYILFHKMIPDTQIDALEMALYYQEMNIDTNMMATLCADLALIYPVMGDMESARYYIKLAEPYLDTTSDYLEPYLKIKSSLASIFYGEEEDDSFFRVEHERMAFKYRRGMDVRKDSVALGISMFDIPEYKLKAKPYLLKVFGIEKFPEISRCVVMDMLAEIYEEENNIDSMELCKKSYETYIKVEEKRLTDENKLIGQYDTYKKDRDAKLEDMRQQKDKQKRISYSFVILILVIFVAYMLIKTSKRHKKNITKQKDVTDNALRQHVYEIYFRQKDDVFQSISKEFNTFYPDAYNRFKDAFGNLTETEQKICLLSFLAFRVKEIAHILNLRENTVSKYRNSIIKKTEMKIEEIMRSFI